MDMETKLFSCTTCGKSFRNKSGVRRHMRSIHTPGSSEPSKQARKKSVNCPLCGIPLEQYPTLVTHLESSHDVPMKEEAHDFLCTDDFVKWKQAVEKATDSLFVKQRGTATLKCVRGKKDIYLCHRSGKSREKVGERLRHPKCQGSKKINAFCPARMKVVTTEGDRVFVNFVPTHVGHDLDAVHLRLSRSDKKMLMQKITSKTPHNDILSEIHASEHSGRLKLLTKQDLLNISKDVKLLSAVYNKRDLTKWVDRQDPGFILLYKPRGVAIEGDCEFKNDLIICLVNKERPTLLCESNHISLDSFKSDSPGEFNLYLVYGITHKCAAPGAVMITSSHSCKVIELFLKRIQATHGHIQPKVVFHERNSEFYQMWISCFTRPPLHLFGTWHVEREWRETLTHLFKYQPVTKFEVLKTLKAILETPEKSEFVKIAREISNWRDSTKLSKAEIYFREFNHFAQFWATCNRSAVEIEMNAAFERSHRNVKCLYSQYKTTEALELMAASLVELMQRPMSTKNVRLKEIRQRHKAALQSVDSLLFESDNVWKVSNSDDSEIHVVERLDSTCQCPLKCSQCQTCEHAFKCTCSDFARGHMCTHIHLVCMNLDQFLDIAEEKIVEMTDSCELTKDEVSDNDVENTEIDQFGPMVKMMTGLDDEDKSTRPDSVESEVIEVVISEAVMSEELEDEKLEIQQQFGQILNMIGTLEGVNIVKNAFSLIIPTLQALSANVLPDDITTTNS